MNSLDLLSQDQQTHASELLAEQTARDFSQWTGFEVAIWDADVQSPVFGRASVAESECSSSTILSDIVCNGGIDFLVDVDCVLVAGLSLQQITQHNWVAVFPFKTHSDIPPSQHSAIAAALGFERDDLSAWLSRNHVVSPEYVTKLAFSFLENKRLALRAYEAESQLEATSERLTSTFEEITLLHRLTQNLSVSSSDKELGIRAIQWIMEYLPAAGCGLQLLPTANAENATYDAREQSELFQVGEFPFQLDQIERIIDDAGLAVGGGPQIIPVEECTTTDDTSVRELLATAVGERDQIFGHLIFVNRFDNPPFEAKDINLLASVAAILGTHCGNYELYRQQSEFLADVVRALTSAIDAKDRYTCGHSDRVARIAVRLARELDCSAKDLHTIYMAGLLHDIGKIGISDAVLQKPGALTNEEYEHIKEHPQLGFNILEDIPQFNDVLPTVLHHHESWDGSGYPHGLAEDSIPLLARITAVADSFDAMSSSRCYRQGMPIDKVESILRDGAGKQWDQAVVNAYFRARRDILEIAECEREALSLNVNSWLQ